MSESCVTWATTVPILVFLGLSIVELGPIYATDRRQTVRRQTKAPPNASALWGGGIVKLYEVVKMQVVCFLYYNFRSCSHVSIKFGM